MFKTFEEMLAQLQPVQEALQGDAVKTLGVTALEMRRGVGYTAAPLVVRDKDGNAKRSGAWIHCTVAWDWNFFTYHNSVFCWATQGQDPLSPRVSVENITSSLRHQGCGYPNGSTTERNSTQAIADFNVGGIAVCKTGVCGNGCVSDSVRGFRRAHYSPIWEGRSSREAAAAPPSLVRRIDLFLAPSA